LETGTEERLIPHRVHRQASCDVQYPKGNRDDQSLILEKEPASGLPFPVTRFRITKRSLFRSGRHTGSCSKERQAQKKNFALRAKLFFFTKSILDRVLALAVLILLVPAMIAIAILIKLDSPGPVFFRQSRVGLRGRVFRIWKFRTMYNAEADIHGSRLTERDDARITTVGRWLRQWSLDEVPQLFNVLSGDMSLVGPRPHALHANIGGCSYADIVPGYYRRHVVKPGITGWAQVNGWRGETVLPFQIEQRVAHDLEYVQQNSLLLDLRIMILTVARYSNTGVF
jgi:lipopolysaccharide/colanic/teichoic acid biosynthesis glycosyltransferase